MFFHKMSENGIPTSFTASVDRPFEPIGVRELTQELTGRNNERLTEEQVRELITNPPQRRNPNERIERLTNEANAEIAAEFEQEKIYNLSLRDLAARFTNTMHDILDDLVNFDIRDGARGFIQIFIQSDRLMYVGMLIIVLTILLMLFKVGDRKSMSEAMRKPLRFIVEMG